MKLQSKVKYDIKGKIVGGDKYLTCIPIKEGSKASILEAAKKVMAYHPDIVEWRVDYFNPMMDSDYSGKMLIDTLKELSAFIGNIPLLLCFRIKEEGGYRAYPRALRLRMIEACVKTGLIDFVDIEIGSDEDYIKAVKEVCHQNDTKLILSFHNWKTVPEDNVMMSKLVEARDKGADIPKLYLTANTYDDALRVARAAKKAKEENIVDEPFCFCAMGDTGLLTRIIGGECGSDFGYFSTNGAKGGDEEDMEYFQQLCDVFDVKS